jgi:hypothetical protein
MIIHKLVLPKRSRFSLILPDGYKIINYGIQNISFRNVLDNFSNAKFSQMAPEPENDEGCRNALNHIPYYTNEDMASISSRNLYGWVDLNVVAPFPVIWLTIPDNIKSHKQYDFVFVPTGGSVDDQYSYVGQYIYDAKTTASGKDAVFFLHINSQGQEIDKIDQDQEIDENQYIDDRGKDIDD